jgi:hypothetical protein
MWAKISEEMGVPWRAAEAMHWQLGEKEMARRAGVKLFTFANAGTETNIQQLALQRNPSHNYAASNQLLMGTLSSAHLCQDPLSRTNLPFPTSGIGQVGGSGTHLIQHAAETSGGYENQNLPGIAEILSLSPLPSYTATSPLTSPTRSTWIDRSSNSVDSKNDTMLPTFATATTGASSFCVPETPGCRLGLPVLQAFDSNPNQPRCFSEGSATHS